MQEENEREERSSRRRFFGDLAKAGLALAALGTLVRPNHLGALAGTYIGPWDRTQYYFYAGLLTVPLALWGLWAAPPRLRQRRNGLPESPGRRQGEQLLQRPLDILESLERMAGDAALPAMCEQLAFGKDQVCNLHGEAVRHAIAHKDDRLPAFTAVADDGGFAGCAAVLAGLGRMREGGKQPAALHTQRACEQVRTVPERPGDAGALQHAANDVIEPVA
jgi:hypothetical protein